MLKTDFIPIVVLLIYFGKGTTGKVLPDYIYACPGFTPECLKKTVQETIPTFVKGIPEFGIVPLDPITQDHLGFELAGGLKIELNNGKITGIRKCLVDSVKYDGVKQEGEVNLFCHLLIKGRYKAHGNILIVQINGEGDAKIKATNVSLSAKIKFEDKKRDGTVYHEIKDISIKHKFIDRVIFDLANLFKGNSEISDVVLRFLNENWKQVVEEFGDPIVNNVIDYVVSNIKKFFIAVPKDEIVIYV